MTMVNFNLVHEGWIPCLDRDGIVRQLGIRDALLQAHDLVEVASDPPAAAALSRLLLVVLHRVLDGPKSVAAWGEAWDAGHFDPPVIDAYLAEWEDRFDLFDVKKPFFQAKVGDGSLKAPSLLDPAAARGNNPTLFDHSLDDVVVPMPAADAARRLLVTEAFSAGGLMSGDGGGKVSGKAAPLSGSWVFMVSGPTLFHTLLLNTPLYDPAAERPFPVLGDDAPVWERPAATNARVRDPAGWLDLLTYPSRRVRLVPEQRADGPVVTHVAVTDGDRPGEGWEPWHREQSLAFRGTKAGWLALRPSENRDLWRDAAILLVTGDGWKRPSVVEQVVARYVRDLGLDLPLGLDAYTLATNQAKYLYWRHQRLPVPARLFADEQRAEDITKAVAVAEKVASLLQWAVAELSGHPESPKQDPDERQRRRAWAEHAMTGFWARLPAGFARFLVQLGEADGEPLQGWRRWLFEAIRASWTEWSNALPLGATQYQRLAGAERHYRSALAITRGEEDS